jgi:hypothetical protein
MKRDVMKAIESLVAERRALADKEEQLMTILGRALEGFGYRLVSRPPAAAPAPARARAPRAAGGPFTCRRCGRRFAQAMHLGRHMAASHGAKGEKPERRRAGRTRAGRGSRRAGSTRRAARNLRVVRKARPKRPVAGKSTAKPTPAESQVRNGGNGATASPERPTPERESARTGSNATRAAAAKPKRTRPSRSRRRARASRRSARTKK